MSDNATEIKPTGNTDLSHRRPAAIDRFYFGSTYYPEHWDELTREADAERMAAAGFNVVRMAEFAWDVFEPESGGEDFTLFDQAIEELGAKGICTIMCTPTATPPRWLTKKYPEILRVNENGVPMQHGSRQHCCHCNPSFRDFSKGITLLMAEHYRDNPHVVGWQTDNEINCHFSECHCDACQHGFQEFLKRKHADDIASLNSAWGTSFWAQTYKRFDEISTPAGDKPAYTNPAHVLDYNRFLSDTVARFQHDQVEILRGVQPKWFVTHNGCFGHIDYRGAFTKDLDFLGWDCYPFFCADPNQRPKHHSFNADRARAWSGNFMVPEQQSGPGGQRPYFHDNPEPGEIRRLVYSSIAHGADSLLHFRWRTCRFGAEEYWCGILDHDNVPRRRYEEISQIGNELKIVGSEVLGTSVHVEAAVAASDMDQNDAHATYTLGLPHHDSMAEEIHGQLYERGYPVGCVHPSDDLSELKLYIIPHWPLIDPAWVKNLEKFVASGGTLVIGARTATRDMNNNVVGDTTPGVLRDFAGVTVEEYGRQNVPDKRPLKITIGQKSILSELWYESLGLIEGQGSTTLAKWNGRHLTGQTAISRRKLGDGNVLYVGTYLTKKVFGGLLPKLLKLSNLEHTWASSPKGVEATIRERDGKKLWFFINHTDKKATIKKVPKGVDLISGKKTGAQLSLKANDVAVVKEN